MSISLHVGFGDDWLHLFTASFDHHFDFSYHCCLHYFPVDDLTAEMPEEESMSHVGRHSFRGRGRSRAHEKVADGDAESDSTGVGGQSKNETLFTTPTTTHQTTVPPTTGRKNVEQEAEKRGDIAVSSESTLSAQPPTSMAPTHKVVDTSTTKQPLTATASASALKPSRSDSLKKSLLALEGENSMKVS